MPTPSHKSTPKNKTAQPQASMRLTREQLAREENPVPAPHATNLSACSHHTPTPFPVSTHVDLSVTLDRFIQEDLSSDDLDSVLAILADNAQHLEAQSWEEFLAKFREAMHSQKISVHTLNLGVRLLCHLGSRSLPCVNHVSESMFTLLNHARISDESSHELFKSCESIFSDPTIDTVHAALQCVQYVQAHRSTMLQSDVSKSLQALSSHMVADTRGTVFVQLMEYGSACPEVQTMALKHFSENLSRASSKDLSIFAKALVTACRSAKLSGQLREKLKACAASLTSVRGLDPEVAKLLKHATH